MSARAIVIGLLSFTVINFVLALFPSGHQSKGIINDATAIKEETTTTKPIAMADCDKAKAQFRACERYSGISYVNCLASIHAPAGCGETTLQHLADNAKSNTAPSVHSSTTPSKPRTVVVGTLADTVLEWRGKSQSSTQVGRDDHGLLVEWRYPDATYLMGRRLQDGIEAYRVIKITPAL